MNVWLIYTNNLEVKWFRKNMDQRIGITDVTLSGKIKHWRLHKIEKNTGIMATDNS